MSSYLATALATHPPRRQPEYVVVRKCLSHPLIECPIFIVDNRIRIILFLLSLLPPLCHLSFFSASLSPSLASFRGLVLVNLLQAYPPVSVLSSLCPLPPSTETVVLGGRDVIDKTV
jgi:hypothetical protein